MPTTRGKSVSRRLGLLAGLSLVLTANAAWADLCAGLPPPAATVQKLEARVATNLEFSVAGLTRLAVEIARPRQQVLGLTRGQAVVRYKLEIQRQLDPSGQWECASPKIALTYGFDPITVFVAREFPPGSCAYQEIHAHELRHLETYKAQVDKVEAEITQALQRRFAGPTPWRGPAGQAQERLQQELGERWIPYVKLLLERGEADQARIDTPEEYARVAASCNGEIGQRLKP